MPADNCFIQDTYTYDGGIWTVQAAHVDVNLYGGNAQYTSLAGLNYPPSAAAWQTLSMVNGTAGGGCPGASYFLSGNLGS